MQRLLITLAFVFLAPAANAELILSTFSVDFFNQKIGGAPGMSSVWVQNSGPEMVYLSVNNTCYADVQVTSDCYAPLYPNQSCTLNIQFQPQQQVYETCNILLNDNSGDSQSVNVTAQGVP